MLSHIVHIKEVFQLLKEAGLCIKLKKCNFFRSLVKYLGHVISDKGIFPDPDKISKVKHYPIPTTADEVRSFLGLAGYYCRFIENFGAIARSLYKKQAKENLKEPFTWSEADQLAFDKLKLHLIITLRFWLIQTLQRNSFYSQTLATMA